MAKRSTTSAPLRQSRRRPPAKRAILMDGLCRPPGPRPKKPQHLSRAISSRKSKRRIRRSLMRSRTVTKIVPPPPSSNTRALGRHYPRGISRMPRQEMTSIMSRAHTVVLVAARRQACRRPDRPRRASPRRWLVAVVRRHRAFYQRCRRTMRSRPTQPVANSDGTDAAAEAFRPRAAGARCRSAPGRGRHSRAATVPPRPRSRSASCSTRRIPNDPQGKRSVSAPPFGAPKPSRPAAELAPELAVRADLHDPGART